MANFPRTIFDAFIGVITSNSHVLPTNSDVMLRNKPNGMTMHSGNDSIAKNTPNIGSPRSAW